MLTERIATYAGTVLVFASPREIIDLRDPFGEDDLKILANRKLSREFAVITACNPLGKVASAAANEKATTQLERELLGQKVSIQGMEGCSPDLTHCEASFAAGLDRETAVAIARQYGQDAIFWFDGAGFWLVGARLDFEPIALPLDARP